MQNCPACFSEPERPDGQDGVRTDSSGATDRSSSGAMASGRNCPRPDGRFEQKLLCLVLHLLESSFDSCFDMLERTDVRVRFSKHGSSYHDRNVSICLAKAIMCLNLRGHPE